MSAQNRLAGIVKQRQEQKQNATATRIQSAFRGVKARQQVNAMREQQRTENAAATKIQSAFRGVKARQKVNAMREQQRTENAAATKIQSAFRGVKARQKVNALREEKAAATKIQRAFRSYRLRKGVAEASPEIQEAMKGNLTGNLADQVAASYKEAGLIRDETQGPIVKDSGRLAGNWSGGVSTQKAQLNRAGGEQLGTTHHTVSDHVLGYVEEGVKRLEAGTVQEQTAAQGFRAQVDADTLLETSDTSAETREKSLFQLRQNLTYGPLTNDIQGDPGMGFDPTYKARDAPHATGLKRDWDQRTTDMRSVHNVGLLLKTGKYELTKEGGEHLTERFQAARDTHDDMMAGKTYPVFTSGGAPIMKAGAQERRDLTIPIANQSSGHFTAATQVGKTARKKGLTD